MQRVDGDSTPVVGVINEELEVVGFTCLQPGGEHRERGGAIGEDVNGLISEVFAIELEVEVVLLVFGTVDDGANRELERVDATRWHGDGVGDTSTAAILAGCACKVIPFAKGCGVGITGDGGDGCERADVIGKGGGAEEINFIVIADTVTIAICEVACGVVFLFLGIGEAIAIKVAVGTVGGTRSFAVVGDAESVR